MSHLRFKKNKIKNTHSQFETRWKERHRGTRATSARRPIVSPLVSQQCLGGVGSSDLNSRDSQKRQYYNTFLQKLKNHKPTLSLARCNDTTWLSSWSTWTSLIQWNAQINSRILSIGNIKCVDDKECLYFDHQNPPAQCACPLKQAWGSLYALIGWLKATYDGNGGLARIKRFI